jgi:hypothetical protein
MDRRSNEAAVDKVRNKEMSIKEAADTFSVLLETLT